ncbi:MAG TPA: flippase [Candidatus Limnocylindria bacterium]|jgi:O-antigen/teichoic acid export membrane protein
MADRHAVLAAKGGGAVFAGRLFVWGMRFGLAVLLARLLKADSYGLYSITITIATLGAAFSVIGLDSAIVRFVAVYRRRADRRGLLATLRVGVGLPMLVSVLAASILLALAGPLARDLVGDPRLEPLFRIAALLVPAMVANTVLAATLQGAQRIGWAVLAEQFAQPIVRLAILVGFAAVGMTAELAVLAMTLATFAATLLLAWFVHRQVSLTGLTAERHGEPRAMLGFSLPVYFSNLVGTFGGNLQTLLLGAMASVASAGIFAVANQIMLLGTLFHSAIVSASMPIFAELQDGPDRSRLHALYQTTSKWTFTLNLPFFLVAVLFPQALLSIFGPEFLDGATALAILAFASLMTSATGTSGAILDMTGHTRVKLVNSTLSVGLAIALNLLLIPPLGVTGAAIASLGARTVVNLLRVAQVQWLVHVGPYDRTWLKPILAGAAAAGAGWFVFVAVGDGADLVLRSAVGALALGATYAVSLWALGLSDDDRAIVSRAARKLTRRRGSGQQVAGVPGEPT